MTPIEKAKELVEKYLPHVNGDDREQEKGMAKKCAIIAVDEILDALYAEIKVKDRCHIHWEEVKKQIELL